MTSIYSKSIQSELYPETSQENVCTPTQNQLDVDLVDKIKFTVAKLKNINEEQSSSKRKDSQNTHVPSICEKIALKSGSDLLYLLFKLGSSKV